MKSRRTENVDGEPLRRSDCQQNATVDEARESRWGEPAQISQATGNEERNRMEREDFVANKETSRRHKTAEKTETKSDRRKRPTATRLKV